MKKVRQALIAGLIEENAISTQDELLNMLLKAGVKVTQATVSRDIKEMRIVKRPAATGEYKYCLPALAADENSAQYMTILTGAAISADSAMNTVVVRCHAGTAQAACAALDSMNLAEAAGTLAGDDTIFILCYSVEEAQKLRKKLGALLGF